MVIHHLLSESWTGWGGTYATLSRCSRSSSDRHRLRITRRGHRRYDASRQVTDAHHSQSSPNLSAPGLPNE